MNKIKASNVRYIKLGENGDWEKESIENNFIKLGYGSTSEIHQECLEGKWDKCRDYWFKIHPKSIKNHIRQIRDFYELGKDTLWITFYGERLYWAICSSEVIAESDSLTITRKVISNNGKWSCTDINGKELKVDNLDGRITKVRAYRGTICGVELEQYLIHRINSDTFKEVEDANNALRNLKEKVEILVKGLWWKDFELLTDLVFSRLGWQRYSVLGKTEKEIDLALYSPSIQKRVVVQIKSSANKSELDHFIAQYESKYKREDSYGAYYVYHSGLDEFNDETIKEYQNQGINLINGKRMAELIISAGLVEWLINKRS